MLVSGFCLLPWPGPIQADSMRCGRALLKSGDSVESLRQRCGQPLSRESTYASVRNVNQGKRTRMELWRYRPGRGSLEKRILVHNGSVVAIKIGSRS
jgi:hypothetical protein